MKFCRSLDDLARHQGCIVVECRCGRSALFSIPSLIALFKERHWERDFKAVQARFRCTGCDRRAPKTYFAQPPVPKWVGLYMALTPPPGVSPLTWARADARERKRLVARARG